MWENKKPETTEMSKIEYTGNLSKFPTLSWNMALLFD